MNIKNFVNSKLFKVTAMLASVLALVFFADTALAGDYSGIGLDTITTNVNSTVSEMAKILTDVALIAGIGFILAAFFKFHQHKLNPTQVPISQGVTLLLIGACLTLFVVMIPTAKKAVFGTAKIAQVGGGGMASVIGSGSNN